MDTDNKNRPANKAGEIVEFTVNGMTMSTTLTKKFRNRRIWSKPDEKKVISFIPGTIRDIFVKEKDHVKENDKLLILEAMKMMNVIVSPVSGRIKRIYIEPGEKVPKGKVMLEFRQ